MQKNKIDEFHEHLNKQNTSIQFTKEIEENGKVPFLDCLVTRENNKLLSTVYRKPTHTDRLIYQMSFNPTSHEATNVQTLKRRVQIVCDSHDSLTDEIKQLNTQSVFTMKNTVQTSSNVLLTSDRTTALTAHTPLQPLYLRYERPPKP